MIIFNFYAIAVAIICLIVVVPIVALISLIPGVSENETLLGVIAYGLVTMVSGVCEVFGLKGRLFFIPMWFLGSVLTFATVCTQYGWVGFGVMCVLAVGMVGMLVCFGHFIEKKEWADAPTELAECQRIQNPSRKEFWEHFQKAFFVPSMNSYTVHMHYHNYQCLELLKNLGVDWSIIDPLKNAFAANTHDDCDVDVEEEQTDEIKKLVAEQLEAFA